MMMMTMTIIMTMAHPKWICPVLVSQLHNRLGGPQTQQATQQATHQATQPPTQQATQPPTQQATQPPTQQATQPPTHQVTQPTNTSTDAFYN